MTNDDHDAPPAGIPAASWGLPPARSTRRLTPTTGIVAAVATAVVGGIAWAALLAYSGYRVSLIAVVVGSLTGTLLSEALGRKPAAGVAAGILTAVACLGGEVVGTWGRITHLGGTFALARHFAPVGDILQHAGGLTYVFVILGVVFAYLGGIGQRTMFSSLARRR